MPPDWLPWLLQVSDSQFPSGSYAHSMGLEELVRRGAVSQPDDLEEFLHHQVLPALLAFDLPFLASARLAAEKNDLGALFRLDEELEAWKLPAELRNASRQIGSRRLALVRKLREDPFVAAYADAGAPCHHLIVCALELYPLPAQAAFCAFGLQTITGYAVAAMKLIRLGQERCQRIIRSAMVMLASMIDGIVIPDDVHTGWFNPLLEIASMRHAHANERLFIS